MNSVVIYGSRHGNTRKIAEAIAGELGRHGGAQLMSADEAPDYLPVPTDLVVIGGPTETNRMTEPMTRFFERVPHGALVGNSSSRIRHPRSLAAVPLRVGRRRHRGKAPVAWRPSDRERGELLRDRGKPQSCRGSRSRAWRAGTRSGVGGVARRQPGFDRAGARRARFQKTLTGQDLRP